ncbi:hypothetical protein JRC04_16840 [Mycolicibacterium sp. S2-37]|uniref:hypothetical protein n=1 Tax=Mycolicibacterium sp. S2-37 TaxID=2810297 RepID=UPI001A942630|nr:hypothetical protein [Mycolicibacterium sp. S2-37]MBO0679133.1 hypothetical protein [Mycolicibacterium sp. S2-37]
MHRAIRLLLGWFAVYFTGTGIWQQGFPRSFYDDFPGFGMHWVDIDGPYNEHLLRDVGQFNVALGVLALTALLIGGVWLARVTGMAALVAALPHQIYHCAHMDVLPDLTEQLLQTAALSVVSVTAVALTVLAFRIPVPQHEVAPAYASRS